MFATLILSTMFHSAHAEAAQASSSGPVLCGVDGAEIQANEFHIGIVGNTRPMDVKTDPVAGRIGPTKGVTANILRNIKKESVDCVVFAGDMVKNGSKKEWKKFQKQQLTLIDGIPVQPVIGDYESIKDDKYLNTELVFPDMGTDIGYNRVGSWSYFDVVTEDTTWRLLFLDANKDALTSRWNEQLLWLDEAVAGNFDGMFVFMHEPWYNLAGSNPQMNRKGYPEELISHLENSVDMMKIRGVFFGGGHANQVMLPNGPYGLVHIGAGGGGAPSEDLYLWRPGHEMGTVDDVKLEEQYVKSILEQVERWHGQSPLSASALDKAFNTGTYEGFPGLIDGTEFPVHGWWELSLKGAQSRVIYHHYYQNESLDEIYELRYTEKRGWKGYNR